MKFGLCLAALLLLSLSVSAFAQNAKPDFGDWENICKDIKAQPITEPLFSGPLNATQLKNCEAEPLYYGFGAKPDFPAALQCAWYERAHPSANGNMNYGAGTLTMLYANGRGAAQNIDMAMRFACEQEWAAPNEMEMRLRHLNDMRGNTAPNSPFDMCDDATSSLSGGKCTEISERFADAEREKTRTAISASFTAGQKLLYTKLHNAEESFNNTRIQSEIDLTGSFRRSFMLFDLAKLRDQFIVNLERFSKADVPQATANDVKVLDAEMNALYQKIMKAPASTFENGTVKADGIRDTQRVWLKLRDAWMEFARAAYPKLSADRVMAQLIRLRLNQLRLLPIDLN